MKKILSALLSRLASGEAAVLCSILASSGSSPRGAGAKMAVFADGSTLGTIGGGAVEKLAAAQALDALRSGTPALRAFDLSPSQINSIGMICGGAVTVYFQVFQPQDTASAAVLQTWLDALDQAQTAWLYLALDGAAVTEFAVYTEATVPEDKRALFGTRVRFFGSSPTVYTEPVFRPGRVYVFGGGHVGAALAPVLAGLDFRVCVYDNRPDFAKKENFPAAEQVIYGEYTAIPFALTGHDYAVIMTSGHQADYEVLEQVLRSDASYIGCIGSAKKIAATNERLRQAGFSPNDISRIHSPIGIDILAETPAEIAISIAAELIRHRKEAI